MKLNVEKYEIKSGKIKFEESIKLNMGKYEIKCGKNNQINHFNLINLIKSFKINVGKI